MTPKERMIAAYRGLPVDTVPLAPEFWTYLPARLLALDMITFQREVPLLTVYTETKYPLTTTKVYVTIDTMESQRSSKVTLAEIARMCGVSKMTVSRAIRNDPGVSAATRQFVMRVAEKESYLPSGYGAGKTASRPAIKQNYVLFEKEAALQTVFFGEIIRIIQNELFAKDMNCSLGTIGDDYDEFVKLYDMLQTGNVGGIFIVGPVVNNYINVLLERFGEVVLVDNPGGPELSRPCSAVFCENTYGAFGAVRHLVELGRRKILLICGAEDIYFSKSLREGYDKALAGSGIALDPSLILHGDFHIEGGYQATKNALSSGLDFDAVFSNDEMACGAMMAIHEAKLSIPGDVAVVGFDNIPLGLATTPTMTTVAVDREQMGRRAVELFLRLHSENGSADVSERVGLMPRLLIRESCGYKKNQRGD